MKKRANFHYAGANIRFCGANFCEFQRIKRIFARFSHDLHIERKYDVQIIHFIIDKSHEMWYAIIEVLKGVDAMSTLRELRIEKKLTQQQASTMFGISLRSYITYENDASKVGTIKYKYMVDELDKYIALDETHGILTLDEIRARCKKVLDGYSVKYCILFGSYAKGCPDETSDVDLLISTDVTGLRFYGIAERLRNELKKKVDLLDLRQLTINQPLLDEILKDGIRIYEEQ